MGRGLITQNLGEGQYAIQIVPARDIDQMITDLNNKVSALTVEIAPLQIEADALTVQINSKLSEITALITEQHTLDPTDPRYSEIDDELQSIIADAEELKQQRLAFYREIALLKMKQFALEKKAEQLTGLEARLDQELVVWCVDYSTSLTGEVTTIEINGEPDHILIQPGGTGGLGGKLNPVITQSVAQSCLNFAIHPGWQKWRPTYRTGTVTSIDYGADQCAVDLDAAVSSYSDRPSINQSVSLSGVTVDYMSFGASLLEVGDSVVVEFVGQSWDTPRVIGFVTDPKYANLAVVLDWWFGGTQRLPEPLPIGAFTAIAAGGTALDTFILAAKPDGTVIWKQYGAAQIEISLPSGTITQMAAGVDFGAALYDDGSLVFFDVLGFTSSPSGSYSEVAACNEYALALFSPGGAIHSWGPAPGSIPGGGFISISASTTHSIGLRSDLTAVQWGDPNAHWNPSEVYVPSGQFIAVSAGRYYSIGVRPGGGLEIWGGQFAVDLTPLPSGSFVDVFAGDSYCMALRDDGAVVSWTTPGNLWVVSPPSGQEFMDIVNANQSYFAIARLIPA